MAVKNKFLESMDIDSLEDITIITFFCIFTSFITPIIISFNSFQQVRVKRLRYELVRVDLSPALTTNSIELANLKVNMNTIKREVRSFRTLVQKIRDYFKAEYHWWFTPRTNIPKMPTPTPPSIITEPEVELVASVVLLTVNTPAAEISNALLEPI